MVFVEFSVMFLATPTVEELHQSDLTDLVDMLSKQAAEYSRLMKLEGVTSKTISIKELIVNIQTAIDAKKAAQKKSVRK